MNEPVFAAFLRRIEQTEAPHQLAALRRELEQLPVDRERDALLGMLRAMLVRRAADS